MFFNKKTDKVSDHMKNQTPTVVAFGSILKGTIYNEGNIHIDGIIDGGIEAYEVCVCENGLIKGSINAHIISIFGSVEGTIEGDIVTLGKNAKVKGDISYRELIVEPGASFEGECKTIHESDNLNHDSDMFLSDVSVNSSSNITLDDDSLAIKS